MVAEKAKASLSLDYLTLLGVTLAVGSIVFGNWREGGHASTLLQLTAFLIVAGGTLGAVLLQTPRSDFVLAMRRLRWIMLPPRFHRQVLLDDIISWSRIARRQGLLVLESAATAHRDPFVRKGLNLLIDGLEPDRLRAIMEVQIDATYAREGRAARVFEAMGGYSPTIGILGAVLGLIHVMQNLSNPAALGAGIAVAFVATIYGVGFANLFFLPIANKLKTLCADQRQYHDMVADGLAMIAEGDSPQAIQSKLEGYLN